MTLTPQTKAGFLVSYYMSLGLEKWSAHDSTGIVWSACMSYSMQLQTFDVHLASDVHMTACRQNLSGSGQ